MNLLKAFCLRMFGTRFKLKNFLVSSANIVSSDAVLILLVNLSNEHELL
jgi:hypothetical protein